MNHWFQAARPKTLGAAIAPVVMGVAMAWADGVFHAGAAISALLGALLIQVGTNFHNDYEDWKRGSDTEDRIGPVRATQAGLIAPEAMRRAVYVTFGAACLFGAYLTVRGGWPIVLIGVASIACGLLYTATRWALGYTGLADLIVLIFFGPVAVSGTYYVQAQQWSIDSVIAGLAPGLFSMAILTVNNLRDIEQDRAANKRTLAVRFGRAFARCEYTASVVVAAIGVPLLLVGHSKVLLSCLALLLALPTLRTVWSSTDGTKLNRALAQTGQCLLVFSTLFSIGWLL